MTLRIVLRDLFVSPFSTGMGGVWGCCVAAVGKDILKMIPHPATKRFFQGLGELLVFQDLCNLEHCLGVERSKNE